MSDTKVEQSDSKVKKTIFVRRPRLGGSIQNELNDTTPQTSEASPSNNSTKNSPAATSNDIPNKAKKVQAAQKQIKKRQGRSRLDDDDNENVPTKSAEELGLSPEKVQEMTTLARWLFSKSSRVTTVEATLIGQRHGVIFEGRELIGTILAANPNKIKAVKPYVNKTGDQLKEDLLNMQLLGFFTPVEVLPQKIKASLAMTATALTYQEALEFMYMDKRTLSKNGGIRVRYNVSDIQTVLQHHADNEEKVDDKIGDKSKLTFKEESLYILNIEPNSRELLIQALLVVGVIIAFCCMKVWPIWLRIIVYYLSLSVLILMSVTTVLHLISSPIFFAIGFRKLQFLPNLFDDELDLMETFTPIVGKGKEHQTRWKAEREAARRKALGLPEDENAAKIDEGLTWKFGILNIIIFLVMGALGASFLGLFSPDNIPEFVVSSNDFFSIFPSLATPEMAAKAAAEQAAAEQAAAESNADNIELDE